MYGGQIAPPTVARAGYTFARLVRQRCLRRQPVRRNHHAGRQPPPVREVDSQYDHRRTAVKHYQENIAAGTYTLAATQTLAGTSGTTVTPAVSSYAGFTAPTTPQTVTIKGDGTTVVNYYYTRSSYALTFHKNNGGPDQSGPIRYGAQISAPSVDPGGLHFRRLVRQWRIQRLTLHADHDARAGSDALRQVDGERGHVHRQALPGDHRRRPLQPVRDRDAHRRCRHPGRSRCEDLQRLHGAVASDRHHQRRRHHGRKIRVPAHGLRPDLPPGKRATRHHHRHHQVWGNPRPSSSDPPGFHLRGMVRQRRPERHPVRSDHDAGEQCRALGKVEDPGCDFAPCDGQQ